MPDLRYYKLAAVGEVLKALSYEQRANLYGGNIYLQIQTYIIKNKCITRGVLIAYDMFKSPFVLPVKKIIPDLLKHADEANRLPAPLVEEITTQKADLCYCKPVTVKSTKTEKIMEFRSYFCGSGKPDKSKLREKYKTEFRLAKV